MARIGGYPGPVRPPRERGKATSVVVIVVALALGLGGCGSFFPTLPAGERTIRIGMSVWPGYEPLYLAQEVGIFDDLGVGVRIVEFTSASDASRAFVHGEIDALATTIVELLALRDGGVTAQAALLLDYSDGGDMVLLDDSLGSIADLRGRSVAVEPQSVGIPLLDSALRSAGLGLDDVDLRLVYQLEVPELASGGAVQAAVSYVPRSFGIEKAGFRPVYSTADMAEPVPDVLSFSERMLETRHNDVTKVVEGWNRAVAYAVEHPERSIRIASEREETTPAQFVASLRLLRFVPLDEQARTFTTGRLERICDRELRRLARLGVVSGHEPRSDCTDADAVVAAEKAAPR